MYDQDRRVVTAKQFLRNSHAGRAMAYERLQEYTEAIKEWDRAVESSPKEEQARSRADRAISRLNAGQIAEAVAELDELTQSPGVNSPGSPTWDATSWYNFACVSSVACSKLTDKKRAYADRAMELLDKAVKAGWNDAAQMKKDTDLDPVREREDFQKLMAKMDANDQKTKEKK